MQIQNKHIQTRVGFSCKMLKHSCEFYQFQMSRAWVLVLELDSAVFMHAHIRHSHHLQPVCDSRKRGCSLRTFGSKQTTINKWIVIFFRFGKSEILHRFVRRGIKPETVLITLSLWYGFFVWFNCSILLRRVIVFMWFFYNVEQYRCQSQTKRKRFVNFF